ncbi:hypothetical protein BT96DRAFT_1020389 [Gymnopus androsaceus JB14]|uniref:Uncharacterized protein n=1 Tax=Gymnopus androsaceus JB14 TaxID=1447944 RepID=A0A6A4HH83_9AGAR|nr:hypothetical protein BT96DRAFT_1020389 [Gymnopus androsaceus JB14]
MVKFIALFALLNAALVSSTVLTRSAAVAAVASKGPVSDSANAITVLTTCNNVNLADCLVWSATTLPVGCTNTAAAGQANDINSVESSTGILCTLFSSTTCTGTSQIINGTVNNLVVVGFANKTNSFECQSN